jgi:hypothetical protein
MGLKGYRLWAMGQLDSTCSAPTHSLKPPGFNPFTYQVRNMPKIFAFKFNLYRYTAGDGARAHAGCQGAAVNQSNAVDPQL